MKKTCLIVLTFLFLFAISKTGLSQGCASCDDSNPCTTDICKVDTIPATATSPGYTVYSCLHIDNGACRTWYLDGDNDGYYSQVRTNTTQPDARWTNSPGKGSGDCNDSEPKINPGASEICGNNVDENCDGILGSPDIIQPTEENLVTTITNPESKGCRARIQFTYTASHCWSSYEAIISKDPAFANVAEAFIVGAPDKNNLEFLSDNKGMKAGTYYIRLTDNTGIILKKTITVSEPDRDENTHLTYTIEPPGPSDCFATLRVKLNSKDCFDGEWFTSLWTYNEDESKRKLCLFGFSEQEGHAKKGEEIVYNFPIEPTYTRFKLELTHYNPGDKEIFIAMTELSGVPEYVGCEQNVRIDYTKLPTTHCSDDGVITFTSTTQNTCFDEMVIHLRWIRTNPLDGAEFDGFAEFTNSKNVSFSGLRAGTYEAIIAYHGRNILSCSFVKTFTLNSANNLPLLSFTPVIKNNRCISDKNGSITANVLGGSAPFSYLWSDGQTTQTANNLSVGEYFVRVTDAAGCSESNELEHHFIVVSDNPGASITRSQSDVTTPNGNNGIASVKAESPTGPFDFRWNTSPPRVDANTFSSTVSGLKGGSYSVSITDRRGCEQVEDFKIKEPATSIINIFPNPAETEINISSNTVNGRVSLIILDQQGRIMKQEEHAFTPGLVVTIAIGELSNGIYFLRAITADKSEVLKFVKQ